MSDIRVLAGNTTVTGQTTFYQVVAGFIGAASNEGAFDYLASEVRASANLAVAASGADAAILVKLGMAAPRLIVPTWRRAEILRDTGRLQLQGAVTLTGAIYADVILAATDMHNHIAVDTQ